MTVATVAIGYADGLLRAFKTGYLILGGRRAKILGRICMDQCIIDASGIDVKEGDTVTIFDESGENTLALAACADTISYELVCLVTKRVARRYIENGKEL
jgi:alanine racemase